MNKEKIFKIENLICFLILSIFCIPTEFRQRISSRLGLINYIAIIIISVITVRYLKRINIWYVFYIFFVELYYLASSIFYEKNLLDIILVSTSFIIPLIIIDIKLREVEFKKVFSFILKVLNIIVLLIVIIGILEVVFKFNIMFNLSKLMSQRTHELISMRSNNDIYRLYSFMGHPLFNTEIFLIFYVLNNIYSRYYKPMMNNIIVILISIFGISFTASKTGLILIIIGILIFNYKKLSIKRISVCLAFLLVLFKSGLFNNTIERFFNGGLTTGRESMWNRLESYKWFPIKFFYGYGNNFVFTYNNYMSWASAAFEYPFRKFALEEGIFFTLLIYISIAIYPIIILIKRRQIFILIGYLIVFIDVNTYNGLSLNGDYMLILSVYIFIIMNLSNILINRKETNKNENSFFNT